MKKLFIVIVLIFLVLILGRNLNPFSNVMFDFHDETQPARVQQFTLNLKNLRIPPRIAPNFSFNMGSPVFNFYSPTAYWITSFIHMLNFGIADSIKISFLLAILATFCAMYLLLRSYFPALSALTGATLLASSPWLAVEIFIRGNIAEIWFLPLFIFSLYLIKKNGSVNSRLLFLLTTIVLTAALTVHNIFIIIIVPVFFLFILISDKPLKNFTCLFFAFIVSSYFLFPAFIELPLTHASQIAKNTSYSDHFLCLRQLWTSPWGYGGSTFGCDADGMSFMLGKLQIIFGILGLTVFLYLLLNNKIKKYKKEMFFVIFLLIFSVFLTVYQSKIVWDFSSAIFALFQFPWRFNILSIFGLAFLSAYFYSKLNTIPVMKLFSIFIIFATIFLNGKFFTKNMHTKSEFTKKFLSTDYIKNMIVYKIPEYLPKTVNYREWLNYEPKNKIPYKTDSSLKNNEAFFYVKPNNEPIISLTNNLFDKSANINPGIVGINIHYFPFWKISLNNKDYIPKQFDTLGRPLIPIEKQTIIKVEYKETVTEKLGNLMTIAGLCLLILMVSNKSLWNKINN